MTLKFRHMPKMLSIKESDRLRARYDPYRLVSNNFKNGNYWKLAKILKRQVEFGVREATAIPTVLMHSEGINYSSLIKEMKRRGAYKELVFCADISKRLAHEFHDELPKSLEELAQEYSGDPGAMVDLAPYYKGEFKHFYEVYRRYGSRTSSA